VRSLIVSPIVNPVSVFGLDFSVVDGSILPFSFPLGVQGPLIVLPLGRES